MVVRDRQNRLGGVRVEKTVACMPCMGDRRRARRLRRDARWAELEEVPYLLATRGHERGE